MVKTNDNESLTGGGGVSTFEDGTVSAPSITFTGEPVTGMWLKDTNELGVTVSETEVVSYTPTSWSSPTQPRLVLRFSTTTVTNNTLTLATSFIELENIGFTQAFSNRYVVDEGGIYYLSVSDGASAPLISGDFQAYINVNGNTILCNSLATRGTAYRGGNGSSQIYELNANDYIQVFFRQNSGASVQYGATFDRRPWLTVVKLW